jgi:hypothetical protein
MSEFEDYLGDGLYVDYDGYQICLAAYDKVSGDPSDKAYLEPNVIAAFIRYLEKMRLMPKKEIRMNEQEEKLLLKLKCFFTATFMGIADHNDGGCETCGFGGTKCASLEAIHEAIDDFIKEENKNE